MLDTASPAVPITLFGAAIAGVPYVPLNYRLTAEQLGELTERISPLYLVGNDDTLDVIGTSGTKRPRSNAETFLGQTLDGGEGDADVAWPEDPNAVAVQLFTSGTTGKPKAAILRHEHLMSYILGTIDFMSAEEEEATLMAVPPYHIAGISAVMSSVYACRRIVALPDFSPEGWLDQVANEGVTNAFVVPTMLSRIVDHLDAEGTQPDAEALRAVAYGGGRMPVQVVARALELFPGVGFTNAYGLTETSSTIALLGPDDHREAIGSDDDLVRARLGLGGPAHSHG